MASDQQAELCSRCRSIDLDDLLREVPENPNTRADPEPPIILTRIAESKSSSCPLCDFLLSMIPNEERATAETISITKRRQAIRNGTRNGSPAREMTIRTSLVIRGCSSKESLAIVPMYGIYEEPFVNYSKAPETPILVDHERVDYEPLKGWCKTVQELQDVAMDELQQLKDEGLPVLPLYVIDCHARGLVPVRGQIDYIALSYVWGPAAVQEDTPGGKSLPTRLPKTVEDAMIVVKELGFRYLWVDRYCLDKSNMAEFQAQLNQMADIYRHARATIIAAAGSDADYGLPGVSTRARIKQPRIRIGDYTLWSSMTDPRKIVREGTWMTRAWTYQEGVFSNNWLAFTDEQVFFQRSNREWANLERGWKVSCEMFPQGGLGADSNCPLLSMYDNIWKNAGDIHQKLHRYTSRELSFQSDILNGMLGLIRRCENGPYPMNHYFGAPVLGPLISHRKAIGRDESRKWTLTEAFLVNLFWRSQGTGRRRFGLPSWSWTGWKVVYYSPTFGLIHHGLSTGSVVDFKLFIQTSEGLTDWEAMCYAKNWDAYEDLSLLPQELYIQAPTIALTVGRDSRKGGDQTMYSHAASLSAIPYCAIFSDEDCDMLIEVNLVDAGVESMIQSSEIPVLMKGIILRQIEPQPAGSERSYWPDQVLCCALVVLEGENGATRVGTVELRPENYVAIWKNDVQHPGMEKKKMWVGIELTDYVECAECRERAWRNFVAGQKNEIIKLL